MLGTMRRKGVAGNVCWDRRGSEDVVGKACWERCGGKGVDGNVCRDRRGSEDVVGKVCWERSDEKGVGVRAWWQVACDSIDIARMCSVLSSPARVALVDLLGDGALCVGALARRARMSQPAVSQHLRILRAAELVTAERRGYHVHYRLNRPVLTEWTRRINRAFSRRERSRCRHNDGKPDKECTHGG